MCAKNKTNLMVFLRQFGERTSFFVHSSHRLGNVVDHGTRAAAGCTFKRKKAIQRRTDNTLATCNPVGTTGTQRETIRSVVALDETCLCLGFVRHSLSLSHLHFSMIVFRFNRPLLSEKKRPACLEKSLPILFSVGLSSVLLHR